MKEEYFWSIVIEQDLVQAGIWTIRNENVAIIATSSALNWSTDEDLVEKADAALTEAVNDFPEDAKEPSKVVFGVPSSWVEDGKIQKPHLDKVRLVSQKLSLSPTGFVVLPEAIAHAVKVKEGSPLTGVVMGVGVGSLDLTVFRLGHISGTVNVGRSPSVVEDVVEGLSRFSGGQNIPTRWLLYDGTEVDLEDIKQQLIAADWKDLPQNLNFLHTPQIEVVSVKEKAEAVSIAGASEIGEIKGIEGQIKDSPIITESNIEETEDLHPSDLGFVIDNDIRESEDLPSNEEAVNEDEPKKTSPLTKFSGLARAFGFLKKIKLPKRPSKQPTMPSSPGKLKKLKLAIIFIPLLAIVGFVLAWLYLPQAQITIYLSPKNLQEAETITLDSNIAAPELTSFTFPAELIEVEVSSEKSAPSTGTTTIGDPARGVITIRNGTSSEVEFDTGDIVSAGGREYAMDEAVLVPEAESPTTPGTATVAVTATEIGEEYNLGSGETLSVEGYSRNEMDAVVEEDLTGGTSEEINVVAEEDITKLREDLTSELKLRALQELNTQASTNLFIEEAISYEVIDDSASASAGDEVDSVSLTMTLKATGLVLSNSQKQELAEIILSEQVPEGFALNTSAVDADFSLIEEVEPGVWEFDASFSVNLLPSIDVDSVANEIAGKQPEVASEYLSRLPGYVRAVVTVSPRFPSFFGNIPRMKENITIEVASE